MLRRAFLAILLVIAAPVAAFAQQFPVTVTDMLGREVTIPAAPQRIVTTSPSALEMLYAAGGTAIARSSTALGVPGAEALADIGSAYAPSVELILAQRPDLIVADSSVQPHLVGMFTALGVPVVYVGANRYSDIPASLRILGQVTGSSATADGAALQAESVAADLAYGLLSVDPVRVLIIVAGRDGTLSVALNNSFIGDLVRLAAGINVTGNLPQSGQIPGFAVVSLETLATTNPDVILVIVPGQTGGPSIGAIVSQSLPTLRAVQNGAVYEIDLETYLQNPGPRAVPGLVNLAAILHPGAEGTE